MIHPILFSIVSISVIISISFAIYHLIFSYMCIHHYALYEQLGKPRVKKLNNMKAVKFILFSWRTFPEDVVFRRYASVLRIWVCMVVIYFSYRIATWFVSL